MNRAFTDEDRLRLLQLMTRRVIAERRSRAEERNGNDLNTDHHPQAEPLTLADTSRWRLLPEGVSLYGWQKECLPLWLPKGRGTIKVATGGGKTLFALAAAEQLQNGRTPDLRLVVVVPTIPLLSQWYDEVRRGNLPDSAIGLMGGGQELPSASELRILICVLNSARDRLPAFVSKAHWADRMLLVVDECHRANADQAQRIFDAKPRYTLGLSATPEQDSESEGLPTDEAYEKSIVGQALGPIIFDFTIKQSLAAGLLTPFEIWHIGLSLSPLEASEHARLSREITDLRKELQRRHRKSRSNQSFLAWCQTQASRSGPAATEAERFIGLANRRKRLLYAFAYNMLVKSWPELTKQASGPGETAQLL
jgi:superfamily II DNA or RNA helicase